MLLRMSSTYATYQSAARHVLNLESSRASSVPQKEQSVEHLCAAVGNHQERVFVEPARVRVRLVLVLRIGYTVVIRLS